MSDTLAATPGASAAPAARRPSRRSATARFAAVILLAGVAAGLAGAGLSLLLQLVQHLAFGVGVGSARGAGTPSFLEATSAASPARLVLVLALAGVVGGVGWWALRRWGAGIVGLKSAIGGRSMPLVTTLLNSVLQIVCVALGISLGRETAPRELAGAWSAWLADRAGLTPERRRLVVAAGAGAGLAAVYDAPLGGALFTLEVFLGAFDVLAAGIAVTVSAVAVAVAGLVLPHGPTYHVGAFHVSPALTVGAILLGPVAGLASWGFTALTAYGAAHAASGWRLVPWMVGVFAATGAVAIWVPGVLGNGISAGQLGMAGTTALPVLAALVLLKPLATAASLRAGAVGGLIAPSLSTGAVLGALCGGLVGLAVPGVEPAGLAVVGAAAMLACTQKAPLMAIALIMEFTHAPVAVLPAVLLGVAGAMGVYRLLTRPRLV